MSVIFNGMGLCEEWRPSVGGSCTWTCSVNILLPGVSGSLATLTNSELPGVLHYYVSPGGITPADGVYFITAKMATASPAMVVGEGYTREGFEFELDCLVMLPQEPRKHDILPAVCLAGRPHNIVDRSFDLEAQPYISTSKKVAHFTCYFSNDGRFVKTVPRVNHTSFVHVTGVITGTALPREGSVPDRLSIRSIMWMPDPRHRLPEHVFHGSTLTSTPYTWEEIGVPLVSCRLISEGNKCHHGKLANPKWKHLARTKPAAG
ncbi:hypothetical protein CALVIDRAFT_527993 [Calocera viscosa TUFC12733]|uniref:Uncharacterized protein n=1 Tax=Calocera viscosa (strain TUFC12733) TaxID=1330018 RepID=A0A167LBI3_CALVF|nr:hypothetical protein CALVIDRAFT_527993 [Calocera viscosa TUFC12733]